MTSVFMYGAALQRC